VREGHGEGFPRFVDIAFGSAREVTYLTNLSKRLGFINEANAAKLEGLGRRIQAALMALKTALAPKNLKTLGP
jgi:four helix bundle protein